MLEIGHKHKPSSTSVTNVDIIFMGHESWPIATKLVAQQFSCTTVPFHKSLLHNSSVSQKLVAKQFRCTTAHCTTFSLHNSSVVQQLVTQQFRCTTVRNSLKCDSISYSKPVPSIFIKNIINTSFE